MQSLQRLGEASSPGARLEEKGSQQGLSWVERAPGDSLSRFPGCSASAGEGILTLPQGEPWGQTLSERSQRQTKIVWFQLYVVLGSADSSRQTEGGAWGCGCRGQGCHA